MKLEGKCCKPANETEYELMKAVAVAAGYTVYRVHTGYHNQLKSYGIDEDGEFLSVFEGSKEPITLHDWVFKATHKDTGELVVPEWADSILRDKDGYFFMNNGASAEPLSKDVECDETYYPLSPKIIITRQPEQSWHERGEFPPVGEVCEYDRYGSGNWQKIIPKGFWKDDSGNVEVWILSVAIPNATPDKFRPIPEKSPRDEWIKRAGETVKSVCGDDLGAIYDAMASGKIEPPALTERKAWKSL